MTKLEITTFAPTFSGVFETDVPYDKFTFVNHLGKIWYTKDGTMPGEVPGTSGKWELALNPDVVTYPPNSVITSDDDGNIAAIPKSLGVLTYDTIDDLHFGPIPNTSGETVVAKFPSRNSGHGLLVIGSDNELYSTGYGTASYVNLSNSNGNRTKYARVQQLEAHTGTWIKVINGSYLSFALTSTGELWFIGYNSSHTSGLVDLPLNYPQRTLTKLDIANVADFELTGYGTTYATLYLYTDDGTTTKFYTAGYNAYGQRAIGSTTLVAGLTEVTLPAGFVGKITGLVKGGFHRYASIGLFDSANADNMWVAGYNGYGQLGNGDKVTQNLLVKANTNGEKIAKAEFFGYYSSYSTLIVLTASGKMGGVGYGGYGKIGHGNTSTITSFFFTTYSGYVDFTGVDAYAGATIAICADGTIDFTGYANYYLRGDGSKTTVTSYTKMTFDCNPGKIVKAVCNYTYNRHCVAYLDEDGFVYYGGDNTKGQAGLSTTSTQTKLVKLPVSGIVDIIMGGHSTNVTLYLLTATGYIVAAGNGANGQLGIGNTSTLNTFVMPSFG